MKINYKKKKKGAALLIAVLLTAMVGSAAIGVTAVSYRQVNIAETYNNGLVAYYAAESGIEQAMLYNKYDKDKEIPELIAGNIYPSDVTSGLLRRPLNFYRYYQGGMSNTRANQDNEGVSGSYTLTDREQVYDLQMFYKQAFVGDDLNHDGTITSIDLRDYTSGSKYQIAKDNSSVFTINKSDDDGIHLFWKWISTSCNGKSRGLEVKVKIKENDTEYTEIFQDPTCPEIANAVNPDVAPGGIANVYTIASSLQTKFNLSALTVTEMKLKPIGNTANSGDGIYFGFIEGTGEERNSSGLVTTINSTGYFAGASRQITANIDRQTGTILDIFNYVIYKGQ